MKGILLGTALGLSSITATAQAAPASATELIASITDDCTSVVNTGARNVKAEAYFGYNPMKNQGLTITQSEREGVSYDFHGLIQNEINPTEYKFGDTNLDGIPEYIHFSANSINETFSDTNSDGRIDRLEIRRGDNANNRFTTELLPIFGGDEETDIYTDTDFDGRFDTVRKKVISGVIGRDRETYGDFGEVSDFSRYDEYIRVFEKLAMELLPDCN